MLRLLALRVLTGAVTILVISIIVFVATESLPGDVANAVLGRDATPESLALVRSKLNLDEPLPERYLHWLGGIVHGDAGTSLATAAADVGSENVSGEPVSEVIGDRLKNTVVLAIITTLLLIPFSVVLGVIAATRAGKPADHLIGTTSLVLGSMPEFVIGTVLVLLLAITWPLLPATSLIDGSQSLLSQAEYLVLPVLTLLASMLAQTVRMVRAGVLQVLEEDYVLMARLKGLSSRQVMRQYVLRNALGVAIQVYAIGVAWMFGGIVVVEAVFQYPGIGSTLVDAVTARDLPVVQAITVIIAAAYVVLNIAADWLTVVVTPKLREPV